MKSKYFAQFFDKNLDGELVEAMGSDGVFILDGRNDMRTWEDDASDRIYKLRNVQKYHGYQIRYGSFTQYRNLSAIKRYIHVTTEKEPVSIPASFFFITKEDWNKKVIISVYANTSSVLKPELIKTESFDTNAWHGAIGEAHRIIADKYNLSLNRGLCRLITPNVKVFQL